MKSFSILSLLLVFAFSFSSCSNEKATVDVYHWEKDGLSIVYYYEVKNLSSSNLLVRFVVEAETEDELVISDEASITVSAGKTRKSSTFILNRGKKIKDIKVVDVKTHSWF